jgi:hypothetical protein
MTMFPQDVLKNTAVIIEFAKSEKPKWATPLANLLVVELMLVTDGAGKTNVGIEWLCQRTSASRSTVERTLLTLCKRGWVVKLSGKQKYRTNTYSVQIAYLPIHHVTKSSVVGAEAQTIAMYYHGLVKALPKIATKNGRMRSIRIAKDWETHWGRTAQDWLDEGYDAEHIRDVIDRAFQVKSWSYCHGLHTLKADFLRLLRKAGWTVIMGAEDNQFPDGCLFTMK